MSISVQVRRGIASLWASTNPILLDGQLGYETDTHVIKVGNGITAYNSLPIAASNSSSLNTFLTTVLRDNVTGGFTMGKLVSSAIDIQDGILQRAIPNIRTVILTTDTLLASDNMGIIILNNASPIAMILPNNLVKGFNCTIYQRGAGQITWTPQSGATALSAQGFTKTATNGAGVHFFIESNTGTNASYLISGYGA